DILPGNAAETILGPTATPEAVAALSHKLGLDLPAYVRYARWIGGALHGARRRPRARCGRLCGRPARPDGRRGRHGSEPGRNRGAELLARDPARAPVRGDAQTRACGRISGLA